MRYTKCVLRMATCHCRLGQFDDAKQAVELVASKHGASNETQAKLAEIAEIKAQFKAALEGLGHQVPMLEGSLAQTQQRPSGSGRLGIEQALQQLESMVGHVPHAEAYHAARAEALLRMGQLKKAVEAVTALPHAEAKGHPPAWRVWLRTQIAFHRGKMEEINHMVKMLLDELNDRPAGGAPAGCPVVAVIVPLPELGQLVEIKAAFAEVEKLKLRGNEAIKASKFSEAVDAYTSALAAAQLPPAIAAVLYSNRAAAHQGLSNFALAIADCCRAKALTPGYAKVSSKILYCP